MYNIIIVSCSCDHAKEFPMKKLAYRFSTVAFIITLMAALLPVQSVEASGYIELDGRLAPDGNYYWPSAALPNPLDRDVVLINGAKLILESGLPGYTATVACSSLGDYDSALYINSGKVDIIVTSGTSISTHRHNMTEFSIIGATSGSCWGGIHINEGASATLDLINIRDSNYGITFFKAYGSISNSKIQYIYGSDQSGSTIPAQSGIGVLIDANNGSRYVTINNTQIHHIYGGNGLPVNDANPDSGFAAGGQAIGINISSGATPVISNSNINNIIGGIGGTGSNGIDGANGTNGVYPDDGPYSGGAGAAGQAGYSGGNGGEAIGIQIIGASPTITGTIITSLNSGKGGNGGNGGSGGYGGTGYSFTEPYAGYATEGGFGGNGGAGGAGGAGGNGGRVIGILATGGSSPTVSSVSISSLTGGNGGLAGLGKNGGNGGAGGKGSPTLSGYGGGGGYGGNGGNGGAGGSVGVAAGVVVQNSLPSLTNVTVNTVNAGEPASGQLGGNGGNGGLGGMSGNASSGTVGNGGDGGNGGNPGQGGAGGSATTTAGIFLNSPELSDTEALMVLESNTVINIYGKSGKAGGVGGNTGKGGNGGNAGTASGTAVPGKGGYGGNAGEAYGFTGVGGIGGAGGHGGLSTGNERFYHPMGIGIYNPTEGLIIRNNVVNYVEGKAGGVGGNYGASACGGYDGTPLPPENEDADPEIENPQHGLPDPSASGGVCTLAGFAGANGTAASAEMIYASFYGTGTPTNVYLTNNTLVDVKVDSSNPAGSQFASGVLADDGVAMTIYNNIISNSSSQPLSVGVRAINSGSVPEMNYNDIYNWESQWDGVTPPDPNYNIAVNPNFDTSLAFQDRFHLILGAGGSDCIDGGWDMAPGLPEFDYHGTVRIIDSDNDGEAQPDMGAYENGCYLEFEQTQIFKSRPFMNLPIKVMKTGDPTLYASASTTYDNYGMYYGSDWIYNGGLAWASGDATPLYLHTSVYDTGFVDVGDWYEIIMTSPTGCFIHPDKGTVRIWRLNQWFLPIQVQIP